MNWLDALLAVFLVVTAFAGFTRGLLMTLLPLVGLAVGIVVAGRTYTPIANGIFGSQQTIAYVIAFALVVLLFLIGAFILAKILRGMLKMIMLGWVDNVAGLVLGVIWAVALAGAFLSLFLKYSVGVSTISDSMIAGFVVDKFRVALALLPGDFSTVTGFFR